MSKFKYKAIIDGMIIADKKDMSEDEYMETLDIEAQEERERNDPPSEGYN